VVSKDLGKSQIKTMINALLYC